ncbi:hypothetical protein GCM10017744_019560 [Streptomyces antimycoticus]
MRTPQGIRPTPRRRMLVIGADVGGTRLMRSAIINRRPRPTEGAEGEEETMPAGSSRKRERQYEHIKESAEQRGASTAGRRKWPPVR